MAGEALRWGGAEGSMRISIDGILHRVYIKRQRGREREKEKRETKKEREREKERHKERKREREREREREYRSLGDTMNGVMANVSNVLFLRHQNHIVPLEW